MSVVQAIGTSRLVVVEHSPAPGEVQVPLDATITARFDRDLRSATVNGHSASLRIAEAGTIALPLTVAFPALGDFDFDEDFDLVDLSTLLRYLDPKAAVGECAAFNANDDPGAGLPDFRDLLSILSGPR